MKILTLDIETISQPPDKLAAVMPTFEAAGNLKDPAKIAANIEEKRVRWLEDAALRAEHCNIAVIGFYDGEVVNQLTGDERDVLLNAWDVIRAALFEGVAIVGHNIRGFDIPFMVRRSMLLGVERPDIMEGRFLADKFMDTMELWACGVRGDTISLSALAAAFGLKKVGTGGDFAALWASDRNAALAYNESDLRITHEIAKRMLA